MSPKTQLLHSTSWLVRGLLIALVVMGCNLLNKSTTNPAGGNFQSNATAQPGNPTLTPAMFDFTAGLDQLGSYHVEYLETDKGQLDGKPYETYTKISRSVIATPAAEDSTIDDLGGDGSQFYLQYIRLGEAAYFQKESGSACQGSIYSPSSGEIPNPSELLPEITNAEKLGDETLNGQMTTHYRFDAQALDISGQTATGEVWISNQGGLVVKYTLEIQPPAEPTGKGLEVEQSIQYELSQINQVDPIALPSGCVPVLTDIPAMPDATNVEHSSASMSFSTASDPAKITAFYDQALASLGWQTDRTPGQSPDFGLMYTQGKQILSITFFNVEGGQEVEIFLIDPAYQFSEAVAAPTETPETGPTPTIVPTPTFDMAQSGLPPDVPLYPGASNVQSMAGKVLAFHSVDSASQIATFYTDKLKSSAWTLTNTTNISTMIQQIWMKGKTDLNITIQDLKDYRMVVIQVTTQP